MFKDLSVFTTSKLSTNIWCKLPVGVVKDLPPRTGEPSDSYLKTTLPASTFVLSNVWK